MATGKKKKTAKKKSQELSFENEIILWILLAVSVLLFVSNFGIGGRIGNAASHVLFGIFGMMAYLFPVILFIGICFAVSNRKNYFAVIKITAAVLLFLALCMFLQLLVQDKQASASGIISAAYQHSAAYKTGGGALGGLFVWICLPNFGTFGSFVIAIVVMIIALVLLTERSALLGFKRGGQKMYRSAKEDAKRYRDKQQQRREEQARRIREEEPVREKKTKRRVDKKVEGVALDTTVAPKKKRSDGLDELHPDDGGKEDSVILPKIRKKERIPVTAETVPFDPETSASSSAVPEYADAAMLEGLLSDVAEIGRQAHNEESEKKDPVTEPQFSFEAAAEAFTSPEPLPSPEILPEDDDRDVLPEISMEPVWEEEAAATEQESVLAEPQIQTDAMADRPVSLAGKEKKEKGDKLTEAEEAELSGQMQSAAESRLDKPYTLPPISLLKKPKGGVQGDSRQHLMETANKLQQTLKNFGVNVTITNVSCGPSVTRYEIQPEMGVKVSKIVNLTDDIKLNLAAADIRMEAPIPGKAAIGIEVPNKENVTVMFRELIESEAFAASKSKIAFAVGKDIAGQVIVTDIAKMPHLLIAGATGSGKSVCINTIIMSILYKAHPDDVKLIMIDPKVVELSVYNGIPHLMIPVVTDPKKAAGALNWAVVEMEERYKKFSEYGVRDLKGYNAKVASVEDETKPQKMPQIVIIVDELADLMMVASHEVETSICRLAQLARAAGIHLIIATQRPSVNVITGLIKANMPSRVAFAVTSGVDSRTILDMNGAEKLLGKGDMLFFPQGYQKPLRVQGAFVTDEEVSDVVEYLKHENGITEYDAAIQEKVAQSENLTVSVSDASGTDNDRDVLFADVGRFLIESEKGSIGSIQRRFKVGFNRAARIMDQLAEAGLVGPEEGTKPRKILMSLEEFEQYIEEYV